MICLVSYLSDNGTVQGIQKDFWLPFVSTFVYMQKKTCGVFVIGSPCVSRIQYGTGKINTVTGSLFYVKTVVFHF